MNTKRMSFLLALLLCSVMMFAQPYIKKLSLYEANIERTDFLILMDSIINFEKKCDYYTDSLFFYFFIIMNPEDSAMYQINIYPESRKQLVFGIREPTPRAFFQYKDHICVIAHELPEQIFSITKKRKVFRYVDYRQLYLGGKAQPILTPEDGPFSIWTYYFYDEMFHFQEKHSHCP